MIRTLLTTGLTTGLAALALLIALPAWADEIATFEGRFIQGGIAFGHTAPDATVTYEDTVLPVSEDGTFVFGFGRNHPAQTSVEVTLADGTSERFTFDIEQREYALQRVEGIAPQYVAPPEEYWERIAAEREQKAAARRDVTEMTHFADEFIWPLTGPLSGTYGSARVYNDTEGSPHLGVDIARPTGTPVVAPAAGVVTLAENDMYYEGGLIFLDHGHGMIDVFMHLSEVTVEAGQYVEQGEVIGLVGAGGRASGPHLDWRMYVMGQRVDPSNLVGPMPTEETAAGGND